MSSSRLAGHLARDLAASHRRPRLKAVPRRDDVRRLGQHSPSEREPARHDPQIEGRVRAAGSEFVLACDMRFAARESAIFGQFEPAFGQLPGGGAAQHLTRLMGRGRAFEVPLGAEDYDAELAERYGWINRALPAHALESFVSSLACRIAAFPAAGHSVVKDRVNAIALAPVEDFRRDSDLFGEEVRTPEAQRRIGVALKHGFQTRDGELDWALRLDDFGDW
jgi:enoyl-CoA hydratase/carnithine racemase